MRISYEEMQRRLGSPKNIANLHLLPSPLAADNVLHKDTRVKREKSPNVPEPLRDTLGTLALVPGNKQKNIAKEFELSESAISQYKTGRVGGLPATSERKTKVQDRIDYIKDQALDKLMSVLGLLGPDKLVNLDASDLGKLSVDMSKVVRSLTNQETSLNLNAPSIVIYSPESKDEAKYKVLDV